MDIALWSDRYKTGIKEIDDQHRALFDAINKLAAAYRSGNHQSEAVRAIDFIIQHALTHFKDEEAWMESHAFPGLGAHRKEHEKLTAQANELKQNIENNSATSIDVAVFLVSEWFRSHISKFDMEYVRHAKIQLSE